jgi:hypothetical protein
MVHGDAEFKVVVFQRFKSNHRNHLVLVGVAGVAINLKANAG